MAASGLSECQGRVRCNVETKIVLARDRMTTGGESATTSHGPKGR